MSILLRMVGAIWVALSAAVLIKFIRHFSFSHLLVDLNLGLILHLFALAGGIGLVLLKEWGRMILLIAMIGFLVWKTSTYILSFTFSPALLKQLVFYGIFIVTLLLPQSRAVMKK